MANILNKTVLAEGTQKAAVHFYLESDGNEGDWVNRVLFDPSIDYNTSQTEQRDPAYESSPGRVLAPMQTILELWSSCSWFDFSISYETLSVPVPMIVVARDSDFYMDYRGFGGIRPLKVAPGTDPIQEYTGRLLITTNNFAPLGSAGLLVLTLRRN